MKGFQEFANRLKEEESKKRQKLKFCQEHNFDHEVTFIRRELNIISEIRGESEFVASGYRKPEEAQFTDL